MPLFPLLAERVAKSGIEEASGLARAEALKTAKMEVKIEVPLLSKVARPRPRPRLRFSAALFLAVA